MPNKHYVSIGKITSAHGIKGLVKIRHYLENANDFLNYGEISDQNGQKLDIQINGKKGDLLIAALKNVTDRNGTEALRDLELFVPREKLPKITDKSFYHIDLIGLTVLKKNKDMVGSVKDVHNYGAGDIIEILLENGKTLLFPFSDNIFPEVNLAEKFITIKFPEEIIAKED
jgi:16S rRNA processing protein RimM